MADALNQQADPVRQPFREVLPFGVAMDQTSGAIRVTTNAAGPFALLEFAAALPRARLYTAWEAITNAAEVVERLADPAFDPARTVLLAAAPQAVPRRAPDAAASTNVPGVVEFVSYAPKRVVLRTRASEPAVLLLNDNYDPLWRVTVNDAAQPLLRANAIMRAVELPAGEHTVEFTFRVSPKALLVSLAGLALSVGLLGWIWTQRRSG